MGAHGAVPETLETASDRRADMAVGWTLLGGLLLSIGVMALGLLLVAIRGGPSAKHVLPLDQILTSLGKGTVSAVLDLGIVLLFATPFVGVLVALAQFVRQRDTPFVLVTGVLLVLLVAGFAVALR